MDIEVKELLDNLWNNIEGEHDLDTKLKETYLIMLQSIYRKLDINDKPEKRHFLTLSSRVNENGEIVDEIISQGYGSRDSITNMIISFLESDKGVETLFFFKTLRNSILGMAEKEEKPKMEDTDELSKELIQKIINSSNR